MAGEVMIPILPGRDLDEMIPFYEALGFEQTYRQRRPNPYAVVVRDDIQIHLFGLDDFDPETSTGNVIVAVPDPDALYQAFAAGLRERYGTLPSAGAPRILRPRKKLGTVRGFSVVDPGGNWLRITRLGDTEEDAKSEKTTGLARQVDHAARLGDAKGDHPAAVAILDSALERFADAPAVDRVRALLYKSELAVRMDDSEMAAAAFEQARSVTLTDEEQASLQGEMAHVDELVSDRTE